MSKFSLFKKSTNNHAELPNGSGVNTWGFNKFFGDTVVGKYSDVYFYSIINKLLGGVANIRFDNLGDSEIVSEVAWFLNNNYSEILWRLWRDGFVIIDCYDDKQFFIIEEYTIDAKGNISVVGNKDYVVFYSKTKRLCGLTDFEIIKSNLRLIDKFSSAQDFLTSTYGAMCLISGGSMPMNAKDKDDLNAQLKTNLGITANKSQFIVSQSKDINMQTVSFDVAGLALSEKIKEQVAAIADYFCIPKDILNFKESSTYENQESAQKRFYQDAVIPLCEVLLELGREIIINSMTIIPSSELSFSTDNVSCLSQIKDFAEQVNILAALLKTDISDETKKSISDKIDYLVNNYQ